MSKTIALIIAGVIFLIVSILHLVRLVMKLRVTIGQTEVPINMSIVGLIVGLILSAWMFMAALKVQP
jgi:hypothetical protein